MLPIQVITGLPGSGKTHHVINQVASAPGKYLFATSRRTLIRERITDIEQAASQLGTKPDLIPIYSSDGDENSENRHATFSVASEIRSLPNRHAEAEHIIALCTHEGLMAADLSGFEGWHLVIDENPPAVSSGSLNAPALALHHLDRAYDLIPEPGTAGWSRVLHTRFAPSTRDLLQDDLLCGLVGFDKHVRSQHGVLVDLDDWREAMDVNRPVKWLSVWSIADLDAFASIRIAAAGYMESLAFKATEHNSALKYQLVPVPEPVRARPRIEINYFTDMHRASTHYWTQDDAGRAAFTNVADYLKTVDLGYWATNTATEDFFRGAGLKGDMVKPRTEGTNRLRHHESCAFVYSSKTQYSDAALLKALKLDKADVERARQGEDIIQFVFRGAIRNPDFAGTYRIYLYDKDQADFIADYLNAAKLGDVHVIPIAEAGIMDVSRPKPGRKPLTPEERLRRDRQRKRDLRAGLKALREAA